MGEKRIQYFFLALFLVMRYQQINLSIYNQALINIVQQTRLTFDLEIEQLMVIALRSGQGHMSVGDSAEEFIEPCPRA